MNTLPCDYCGFQCSLKPGETGKCGVRIHRNGRVETLGRLEIIGPSIDPIEKKPLYRYLPGSLTFSLAQRGCNFRCPFCQNYHLAFPEHFPRGKHRTLTLDALLNQWRNRGKLPVAFTYSEPAVWQDTVLEFGALVKAEGGKIIIVSNGCYSAVGLERLMKIADAFNIDIKGGEEFYKNYARAPRIPVLKTIQALAPSPEHHLEVTTLFIPGVHSPGEMMAIHDELVQAGVTIWHISAFHPAHTWRDRRPAYLSDLQPLYHKFKNLGQIPWIYLGNLGNLGKLGNLGQLPED